MLRDLSQQLIDGAASLGVALSTTDAARLLQLLEELLKWNRTYNLTAIVEPQQMLTHHLLDSLSINGELRGERIADVGTGAGFPGLPLALINPGRQFTLIDSNNKKIRFVTHAARLLGLSNVTALHARVEQLGSMTPAAGPLPMDSVVARAFAALPALLQQVAPLCGPETRVLAMKGRQPAAEIEQLPAGWRVERSRALEVPGLHEDRHLVILRRSP